MSPSIALHSRVFLAYAAIVVALLAVAGAVLLVLQRGLHKDVSAVWRTYRGWLIMIPLITAAVLLGRGAVVIGTTVLAIFAFKEFARATGLYEDWWMTGIVYLAIVAGGVLIWIEPLETDLPARMAFLALPAIAAIAIVAGPILRNVFRHQLQGIALSTFGFLYVGWMLQHAAWLANEPHPYGKLLYLVFATEVNDVAAFTCGRLFGRLPLRSQISPRKTWGGAIGACAVSLMLPWLMRFSFPNAGAIELIAIGLIVGVGGQFGDLAMSVIKRDIGLKDMGGSIPGHGGLLDRLDSLLVVAPLFVDLTWLSPRLH